jgi:acetyl coenzyme A synthetase (ADP forming)-like protein
MMRTVISDGRGAGIDSSESSTGTGTGPGTGSRPGSPHRATGTRSSSRPADPTPVDPTPVDVLLADGSTARVRCATPGDRAAIASFHERLSSDSAASRYFRFHPHLDDADLDRMTACGPDHLALLAERDEQIVAVAEYHRALGAEDAEVAFVVDDAFHGRGLATLLLEHLASQGRRSGVRRLVADTLTTNSTMLRVFHDVGFAATQTFADGVVHVVLDIAPSPDAVAAAERRDTHAVVTSMRRLFAPRSIAVIGASRRRGAIGNVLVRNLVAAGFTGPVYPVNPNATSIASLPCWAAVTDILGPVDLAVVAVPARSVPDVVASCGAKGVEALVVVSAGFAETGADGVAAQRRLTALAHEWGMRLVGPNCFGIVSTDPDVSMNATFAADAPLPGRVGFASQSGGLGIAILAEASSRGLGLSNFVSMGNKADISGNDLLAWWEQDPATDVALLYLESFGNPRRFARLAQRISRAKPIVAVKGGRTTAGAAAASSHTAALASSEQAVDALFRRCGVIRVDTVEELFDVSEVLAQQPLPSGARVGIVTNAGGPGVLAADACAGRHLEVPTLSIGVQSALRTIEPDAGGVRNPVDLGSAASPEAYRRTVDLLMTGGEVDAVVVIFTPPLATRADDVAAGIVAGVSAASARGSSVPVVATFLGTEAGRGILRSAPRPIPCFVYPETAVRALAHAVDHARWRDQPSANPQPPPDVDVSGVRRQLVMPRSDGWLTGARAMAVLRRFDITVQPTIDVDSPDAAGAAAATLGADVALKVRGPDILHKSDVGGVKLRLAGPARVQAAYEEMAQRLGTAMTGATVQSMAPAGVEMIVGFVQDRQFGPVALVGMGGTVVELLGDHAVGLAPLDAAEAQRMILGLRGAPLLTGFRGSPPVAVDALVDVLVRMSWLSHDFSEIEEADANPVVVTPTSAVVVDARLRLADRAPAQVDDRRHLP